MRGSIFSRFWLLLGTERVFELRLGTGQMFWSLTVNVFLSLHVSSSVMIDSCGMKDVLFSSSLAVLFLLLLAIETESCVELDIDFGGCNRFLEVTDEWESDFDDTLLLLCDAASRSSFAFLAAALSASFCCFSISRCCLISFISRW